jgi:hypothetical protein
MWTYIQHARTFIEGYLPFWNMVPDDELIGLEAGSYGGAEAYAIEGQIYALYFPTGSNTGELNLKHHTENFELRWYNPRTGEFEGAPIALGAGGGWRDLPNTPGPIAEDWVALVRRPATLSAPTTSASTAGLGFQTISLDAGASFAGRRFVLLSSYTGTQQGFALGGVPIPIDFDRLTRFGIQDVQGLIFKDHFGELDASGSARMTVQLSPAYTGALVGSTLHHVAVTLSPFDFVSNVITLEVAP